MNRQSSSRLNAKVESSVFRASSPAENDLIEARFHVANAEVFTEAMSENARAIKELARRSD
jgi:hypothetical protein